MIIVDSLRGGETPDELLDAYPPLTLPLERIAAVQELLRIHSEVTEEELTMAITSGEGLRYFLERK